MKLLLTKSQVAFTLSEKNSSHVFELRFARNSAETVPFRKISAPEK